VYGYFHNGGSRCYVVSIKNIGKAQAALVGADGKPRLVVRAKQAGFDGLRLRVKVDVQELPAPKAKGAAKGKEGEAKEGEEAAPAEAGELPPFTITVERQGASGAWQVKEVLPEVTLVEAHDNGAKKVQVAYKNNRASEWIDVIPDTAPLAKVWPTAQQQSLNLEQKMLMPATSKEFRGEVTERTGVEGLEVMEDVTMLVVPDLMSVPPGEKLNLDMVKAVQTAMIAHCERLGDRVAILDAPPNATPQEVKEWRMNIAGYDSSYAALYYP